MPILVRPALPGDFEALAGGLPPFRVRALAGVVDGRLVGLGGLAFPPSGGAIAWAHLTEEARRYPLTLHRAGLATLAWARGQGIRRIAAEASDHPAAAAWLARLGFRPEFHDEGTVFVWQP